ncbi:MAG TPA: M14 family metallopeptidase [Burkholderiales bacterium]|nr:M14 family metallopeptidase [Burkholderiales bacterium]
MSSVKPLWADEKEGRFFTRIEVTTMLNGSMLGLPLHVVTGRQAGPTLGVITNTHGDEFLPTTAIRTLLSELDTSRLKGRLAVISVANPLATAAFGRLSPEQHGRTDLHEVYPGTARGNTTQMIAAAIVANVIDHADAFIDFHSGGSGGRLQARVDYHAKAEDGTKHRSLALARAFGMPFVHENDLTGTAASYANSRGIPAFDPEMGGSYLGPENTALYRKQAIAGLTNVMTVLGMLDGKVKSPRQLHFGLKSRREIRPRHSGYLASNYERADDLGKHVKSGTRLGEVVDIYSYDVLEELTAPCDGYLFFSRYSGVVGAGTQAFAIAEAATSEWLDNS